MFREIRRKDRSESREWAWEMLGRAKWGTLSLAADVHGYPHAVPINCALVDGTLVFHCARQGAKLDIIRRDGRACFSTCVLTELVLDKLSARYESVICYGRVREVADERERLRLLTAFTAQVFDVSEASIEGRVQDCAMPTLVLQMQIDHITGKRLR